LSDGLTGVRGRLVTPSLFVGDPSTGDKTVLGLLLSFLTSAERGALYFFVVVTFNKTGWFTFESRAFSDDCVRSVDGVRLGVNCPIRLVLIVGVLGTEKVLLVAIFYVR